jgi:hypothetical protein
MLDVGPVLCPETSVRNFFDTAIYHNEDFSYTVFEAQELAFLLKTFDCGY